MAKPAGRQRSQLPNCYYEGYLEKRSFKDKKPRKLWACLCGNDLFFFNEKRETDYIEKLSLSGLISITDDNSVDSNLEAARLNLQLKDGNIKFTATSAEARELWKGFIHSVAELSVPPSLNLLPGQIHMLKEAVEKEKERISNSAPIPPDSSPHVDLPADMPACFHKTASRLEAELLLEREAMRGNLLLRPGSYGNFAVTTRQDLNGSVFRHYRVTRKEEGGFIIDVDNPIHCSTLCKVIDYLVEATDRVLIPLIIEEQYAKKFSFIRRDNENGEKFVENDSLKPSPPSVPPKPVFPIIPTEPLPEENFYLNDTLAAEEEKEDFSVVLLPEPDMKASKKAMMPPTPVPRKRGPSTSSTTSLTNSRETMVGHNHTNPLGPAIFELKKKLEKQLKAPK